MNLLELSEPLFQYVCILNRAGRKGGNLDYNVVRSKIKSLLEDLRNRSLTDPGSTRNTRRWSSRSFSSWIR